MANPIAAADSPLGFEALTVPADDGLREIAVRATRALESVERCLGLLPPAGALSEDNRRLLQAYVREVLQGNERPA